MLRMWGGGYPNTGVFTVGGLDPGLLRKAAGWQVGSPTGRGRDRTPVTWSVCPIPFSLSPRSGQQRWSSGLSHTVDPQQSLSAESSSHSKLVHRRDNKSLHSITRDQ
ncbi:hypothetical protein SKAU_G00332720 [Synaphobranchus kaupii]|uniref:Uncharacterized protein n=1 Tax=Synaphobranchus kaupii TaxID=118154 RepID=A0A9Q1IIM3_SYNKA|nr:hypothetical protein SKAU_G00332720 [Synaphobranchus kaupii]